MAIKTMLDEEIERLLSHIASLSYGSDERKAAVSELDRLYKLRIEETKNEQEYQKDCERRAMERELHQAEETLKRDQMTAERELHEADEALKRDQMSTERELHQADEALKREQMAMEKEFHQAEDQSKREQLSDQVVERYFRYGAIALELVLPIVAYGIWYNKGLKFEETGTITSSLTRNLVTKLLPKRK